MERVQTGTRHAGAAPARRIDDWRTLQLAFTTVRPLKGDQLEPGRAVTLTDGVRIEPHPTLRLGEPGSPAYRRRRGPSARWPRCPGCSTTTRRSSSRSSSPPTGLSAACSTYWSCPG